MLFTCINKCYYKERVWKIGEKFEWEGDIVECNMCAGTGCVKCRNTGRMFPPHHFVPDSEVEPAEQVQQERVIGINPEVAKIAKMRQEFNKLGVAYDSRWGLARLKNELVKAQKSGINREPITPTDTE